MFKTIRGKIIFNFLIILISVFLLFSIISYRVLGNHLTVAQLNSQTSLAEALCKSIDYWKSNCEDISVDIVTDPYLQDSLLNIYDGGMTHREELADYLEKIKKSNTIIEDIFIVDKTYSILGTGDTAAVRPYVYDRISRSERYAGSAVWDSGYDTKSMILYRNINDIRYNPNDSLGYLFIQIDNNEILQLFNSYRLYGSQRFSLKGTRDGFEVTERGFFYNYYDNYINLLHSEITMGDWYLRTWSDKAIAMEPAIRLLKQLAAIVAASLVATVLFSLATTSRITKPIRKMREIMEYYGEGDFTAKVEIVGNDELARLGEGLNQMSEQISDLFDVVKEEENQRRKLELQTLVYQINPHFLYNTLDSVNILARQNKDDKVAEIVTDLSRLFRLGLHKGQDIIPVRDEIMHVTYYLKIQEIRFSEQLKWKIQVDESIMNQNMVKFILQPIVENAIYHGVKSKDEPGLITVAGYQQDNAIIFQVEDTGMGMEEELCREIEQKIHQDTIFDTEEGGFGLINVSQRIRLMYGVESGLFITSTLGQGTIVEIRLIGEVKV
ncbi:MAG TPA: sensor histidine kinase [Clostridiales bacterium]|nr:sensor histidine kinase [Clostridiales bacterium]